MIRHTGVLWCMLIYQMNMGTGKLVDGTTTNIIPLGERKYRASFFKWNKSLFEGNTRPFKGNTSPLKGNTGLSKETRAFLKGTKAFV